MYKVAIFASGSGSNALKIIQHFSNSKLAEVTLVITNRRQAGVLNFAKENHVPTQYFPVITWKENPEEIAKRLSNAKIDFVVLAGFLLKVPSPIVEKYAGRMLNIHPALLPKYGGKGMYGHHVHQAVKDNNEIESGITIHYVNHLYDDGQVVFQTKTPLTPHDSAEMIQKKVLDLEHAWFPKIIEEELQKLNTKT